MKLRSAFTFSCVAFAAAFSAGCGGCGAQPLSAQDETRFMGGEDPLPGEHDPCGIAPMGEGVRLAEGLNAPRRIAVGGDRLWISEAGSLAMPNGRVLSVPTEGGAAPTVLAAGFTAPDAIAVDADAVFVVDTSGLWKVARSTGVKTLLSPTQNNATFGDTELTLVGDQIVFSTGLKWLMRVNKDGTQSKVLHQAPPGAAVRGNAVVNDQVYFLVSGTNAAGLYRVELSGNAPAQRIRTEPLDGRSLLVDADEVLWTRGSHGEGQVQVASLLDSSNAITLSGPLSNPARPVVIGNFVYLKDGAGSASERFFLRVSRCSAEPKPVGPIGLGPGDLTSQGDRLFFSSQESGGQGYVSRLP